MASRSERPIGIEIENIVETGSLSEKEEVWQAYQVYTHGSIYCCDWRLVCVDVISRSHGKPVPNHRVLGFRLTGGQLSDDKGGFTVSYPLPNVGFEAVFESPNRKSYATTSAVKRVVLRLRTLSVAEKKEEAWENTDVAFVSLAPPMKKS